MFSAWMKLSSDVVMANFEAQRVIALRMAKLAEGGTDAEAESRLMVMEKVAANTDAAFAFAAGKSPSSIVRRYRTIMRANGKRLSKR